MTLATVRTLDVTQKTRRFNKPAGIKARKDFLATQNEGRRYRGKLVSLFVRPTGTNEGRVGYTISRKVGNAVVRNRVRRRLRELVRLHPDALLAGRDHVLIAYNAAATASYEDLEREVLGLFHQATRRPS